MFSHLNSGGKIAGGWANLCRVILLFPTQLVLFFFGSHTKHLTKSLSMNPESSAFLFHIKEPYQYHAKETFQGRAEEEIESLGEAAGYYSW